MSIEIINDDALAVMREMEAQSVDCVVTDPPFFAPATHYQSRISWGRSWSDLSILGEFFYQFIVEAKRIIKHDGSLFVFCHDESYPVLYPSVYGRWDFSACLIWDKIRPGLGKIFRHRYEMILWASNSHAKANSDGVLHTDILSYKAILSAKRKHPVQKPPELIEELITITTNPGDLVFDPFMGGGSTGIAAKRLGRSFIGVDLDPQYCKTAESLISEDMVQLPIQESVET